MASSTRPMGTRMTSKQAAGRESVAVSMVSRKVMKVSYMRRYRSIDLESSTQGNSLEFDWNNAAARLLKAEIARADITLAHLAARLTVLGEPETDASVRNKLYRGTFSLGFFMRCMAALGHRAVDIDAMFPVELKRGADLDTDPDEVKKKRGAAK